ncbi:hypothetical protein [Jannaschia formosa]|nr:hypothetical protein [Jannaschia formosa]
MAGRTTREMLVVAALQLSADYRAWLASALQSADDTLQANSG